VLNENPIFKIGFFSVVFLNIFLHCPDITARFRHLQTWPTNIWHYISTDTSLIKYNISVTYYCNCNASIRTYNGKCNSNSDLAANSITVLSLHVPVKPNMITITFCQSVICTFVAKHNHKLSALTVWYVAKHIRPLDIRTVDIRTVDIRPADIRHLDIRPVDIRPIDIRTVDIRPVNMRPLGIRLLDIRPLDIRPLHIMP
jgi:hypothetical protein